MNLKHGFYSRNEHINPDSVFLHNAVIKKYFMGYAWLIKLYLADKILPPHGLDLVYRLIDIAMPGNEHLLPKSDCYDEICRERGFLVINRNNRGKTTPELVQAFESLR